jgi:hypothetical protein
VFHEVCSQTLDPDNYAFCINDWGPIELSTLNAFLDWLQTSGQQGGAPPRTAVETVSQVMNGPDTVAPISALDCDSSPCQSSAYSGSTTISLASKDPGGSGVAATYYTTDGTAPTTSSPKFVLPFTINQATTISYFSVDNSGNVEPVQSQTVTVAANVDPVIGAAGDIACDPDFPAFNDGLGTATDCRASHTVNLLSGTDAVLPLGDVQYQCSGPAAYAQAYNPTWGVKKSITHPVPGGEDYLTSGGTDCQSTPGAGYFQYFGAAAGDPTKGYYSYNLGQWHVVAINTAPCENGNTDWCAAGSEMDQWLQQDLAANHSSCTLAYYQDPRWASAASGSGGDATYQQIWADLYNGGVDVALNGDSHWYERFAPLNASGAIDNTKGVREFIVGTGGAGLDTPGAKVTTSQVLNNTTHGVIRMTLHSGSYDWAFVPDEGTFTDSGAANCHGKPDQTAPTTTAACNGAACSAGWYQNTAQVSLTATDNTGGSGVDKTYYTTDGSTPTTSSNVYTAPFPIASTSTVKYFSVDKSGNAEAVKSQSIQIDPTPPATLAACNLQSCSGTYTTNVQFALTASDNTGGSGVANTFYTTDGTTPTGSSSVYSSPLNLTKTTTVKYFSVDAAGNAEAANTQVVTIDNTAPTTTIRCNNAACSSGFYPGTVQVSLSATDAGGVGQTTTYYTTDGTTPTTSSIQYSGPFPIGTTATVKFFSVDGAHNSEAPQSQQIQVDPSAPTTTAACNSQACANWFNVNVSVNLTASDTGGSGVSKIYYTTDGSTPTRASTVFTAPLSVTATTTVKFFAVDNAGNAEAVKTVAVQIDKTAPTTTIRCNNGGCGTTFPNSVTVTLAATDNTGGSGVSSTHYTTDGTTPTLTSPVYGGSFTLASSATVGYRSWDTAGNVEAVHSQSISVRADAPPVPVLKVTPASGQPPLAVTADASGSTDTDATGIKNYTYNWGDGSASQTTTAKTAGHTYSTVGTFTVTLTVTDTANLSAGTTAQVVVQPNLVGNATFDSNTTGWATGDSAVSLTRVTNQKHSGPSSAQIRNTSGASRTCKLTDSPPWVSTTASGTYTASLWVKAPSAGATLTLALSEMSGATVVGSASSSIRLTTSWQQVTVSYTVKQPGATALDFSASVVSVPAATTAFYADDAALVRN